MSNFLGHLHTVLQSGGFPVCIPTGRVRGFPFLCTPPTSVVSCACEHLFSFLQSPFFWFPFSLAFSGLFMTCPLSIRLPSRPWVLCFSTSPEAAHPLPGVGSAEHLNRTPWRKQTVPASSFTGTEPSEENTGRRWWQILQEKGHSVVEPAVSFITTFNPMIPWRCEKNSPDFCLSFITHGWCRALHPRLPAPLSRDRPPPPGRLRIAHLASAITSPSLILLWGPLGFSWAHSNSPGHSSHLKFLSVIISARFMWPYKVAFSRSWRWRCGYLWGAIILPSIGLRIMFQFPISLKTRRGGMFR